VIKRQTVKICSYGEAPHHTRVFLDDKEIKNCIGITFKNTMKERRLTIIMDAHLDIDGKFLVEHKKI